MLSELRDRIVRNGKGKRPEGYMEPPLEELAKLRKPVEKEEVPDLKGSASPLAAALEAVFNGETPQYEGFDTPAPAKPTKSSGRSRSRRRSDSPKPQQQRESVLSGRKSPPGLPVPSRSAPNGRKSPRRSPPTAPLKASSPLPLRAARSAAVPAAAVPEEMGAAPAPRKQSK